MVNGPTNNNQSVSSPPMVRINGSVATGEERSRPERVGKKRLARDEIVLEEEDDEVVVVMTKMNKKEGGVGGARGRLSLDIEHARRASMSTSAELDSPLVRSDKVLTSVAPSTPSTPPIGDGITFSDEQHNLDLEPQVRLLCFLYSYT